MARACLIVVLAAFGYLPPAAAQTCTNNAGEIVDTLYRQILERQPDFSSSGHVQQLGRGGLTVRQLAAELAKSPEHRTTLWQPVVAATFRQVRNGAPDPEHVRTVARSIAEGRQTLDDVAIAFAAEEAQSQSGDAAVIALYRRLLGRDPSPEDVAHFRGRMEREGPHAVAQTIITSPEYRQRHGRNAVPAQGSSPYEASIHALYRRLLGRDADAQGLAQFARTAAESGFDAVVDQLVASAEYRERFGDYGVPGTDVRYCAPVGTGGR
jgi:hypothetical protein